MARDKRGVHPNFYPTRSYETITKWADEFNMVERIPSMMRRAFTKLRSGRPGPVLLEIPADVATAELPEELFDYESPRAVKQQADPSDVSRAAAALLAAERPVIQAGQGVLYAEATDELVELAEFLQSPVMTTLPGKSAFPENHPLAIGTGGPSTTAMVNKYLHGADTVFGVGASLTKSFFAVPIADNKTFIHLTNDEDAIGREYRCHYPMLGDAKLVLRQLLDALKDRAGEPRPVNHALQADIRSVKEVWLAQWMPKLTSNEKPMNPYRVVWDMMHTVDLDNTIVTHESGSAREYMSPFWEARAPRSFIGWGKSTQLGYSLGLAMGAKLAFPDKQVINVMGDMAFSTVGLDIETAVRCDIPILTVVNNNSFYVHLRRQPLPHRHPEIPGQEPGRPVRRGSRRHGRLRRENHRTRRNHPRHQPRHRRQRRWRTRRPGVHNPRRRQLLQVLALRALKIPSPSGGGLGWG